MVDFEYLVKGLAALSRAHRVNTMAGHLGAAVVSGYFIAEQHPDLDPKIWTALEGELERIIRGESVFTPRNKKVSVEELFAAVPKERPQEKLIDAIADALARNIQQTRQSGHNVIFASIAIRALKDHPDFATPYLTDGIAKLITGFNNAGPGSGYYGKAKGRIDGRKVTLPPNDGFPLYEDITEMANVVTDELIEKADRRLSGFGGLWHVINHAAALVELAQYGYKDLASAGLAAQHQHVRLLRTLPNLADEIGNETPTEHDPRTAPFWQPKNLRRERAHLTHRPKTIYGFYALEQLVADAKKRQLAEEKLRYLM